jgi:Uma2 family endonuclease
MDDVIEKPMSVEEFDALPESLLPHQYIEGKLILAPSPEVPHQTLVLEIAFALESHVRARPELGKVLTGPLDVRIRGRLGEERYQPDVMFFARDHLDRLEGRLPVGPPDLAVEVLSPGTRRYDLNQKRLGYARSGVQELWVIDPVAKGARVWRLQQDPERPAAVVQQGGALRTDLLPGFELPWGRLFAP